LKSFRNSPHKTLFRTGALAFGILAVGWVVTASGALPDWIRNTEVRTEIEAAFFRLMSLPGGDVLFRRPPRETRPALGELIKKQPKSAELYSLRALEDEQQLDFGAAESDWKLYAENSSDKAAAQLALADFYHRRLKPEDEIKELSTVATAPAQANDNFTPPAEQRSWQAFERIFRVIHTQALPKEVSIAQYRAWIARYPHEEELYGRFLEYLISQREFEAANQLIAEYHKQFPSDDIFPVKAKALLEYQQGSLRQGLAVYEKSFQPLWAPELVKSYFDLLTQTRGLRKFLDQARAAVNTNPEDLNATARIFYYYQQQGKLDAAQQTIANFRLHKDAVKSAWTAQELYVCARLLEDIHDYPESARYYFALYNSKGMNDAHELAISGLANLLLTAPETPIRIGSGELSMYKDIATLDQGPGYLNGILSLILNSTGPAYEYPQEEQRAVSYFHRSRAAELLALLDAKYPGSPHRAELHTKLLEFYASSGESEAVLRGGKEFLAAFPKAPQRTDVALLMADADARTLRTQDEFAIYDSLLQELAAKADRMPLGARAAGTSDYSFERSPDAQEQSEEENLEDSKPNTDVRVRELQLQRLAAERRAFQVKAAATTTQTRARSPEYARVLERYLARLAELKQIPVALGVLRREIEHNPDDPGLYERLAVFLDQNRLGTELEETYRRAMARFPDRTWYHKLARYYLRERREGEYEKLTQDAVKVFKGTELEAYFKNVVGGSPVIYLRVNQYANARFPHNPVFVHNLLGAYHNVATWNPAAWEALLRQHWFEEEDLRNQFFEFLSSSGKLEAELRALQQAAPANEKGNWSEFVRGNPAAGEFLAEAHLWRSHFEESAPLLQALAEEYPAEQELDRKASSVFRSLAYFDASKTDVAVKIESNLLAANPDSTEILTRIGDMYSDRELFAQAALYWERIPKVAPGESGGYLEAATIYWDYFDFENALRLLEQGREKLGQDALYGYEAGAIYENKRDYPRAIQEYSKAALDAGPESPAANRLLELARRPKFRQLADRESEKLMTASNFAMPAVYLRVRVLEAQDRKPELSSFLDTVLKDVTTIEQAAEIEGLAQQKSLESVRQHALEKQAALATDSVTKLQLRYALVHLYEGRKDFGSAQRNIETLYRENPKILGVVRSTVDFYWRVKQYPQAIAVLLQAAKDAYPALSTQFSFEAARKSTDARQFEQARDLLAQLLKESPYDSQYLAAMADTYAQAGDQLGLKQFYLDKIALFRNAPLSSEDRKTRIASMRRGLIPALTRLMDYAGVVDQYIELVNVYPEDEGLVNEATLYALRYKRQPQLVDFYSKTVQQSLKDYRWSMVLARIHTSLEDFPAAIDTYGKSITIRPDRADLRIARASLAERLMRFDDAVRDYERIYQLAYKDPKWMEKIAEVRARQGKTDDAAAALKTALIDVGPERAGSYFEVARRLENWGMLPQAREFAEKGVSLAGGDLLASADHHEGAKLYARILTRLRQQDTAYATLQTALSAASSPLAVIKEQVAKQGIAAVTDQEWRQRTQQLRFETARNGMRDALAEMGSTVASYFTPEEKATFAQFAQSIRAPMSFADVNLLAYPLVQNAGLAEVEARWRYELMMTASEPAPILFAQMTGFVELQRRRLKFAELGPQLERFAPRINPQQRTPVLLAAADAFRAAGDAGNELRLLSSVPTPYLGGEHLQRYLELLLFWYPQQLVQMASNWTPLGQQAADFVIANGDAALAHAVVNSRGKFRPPVWTKSYTTLAGVYFGEATPEITTAFLGALGDQTVGERLGKQVNRNDQLAGDIWFYYGGRYGEYLAASKQKDAGDFLAAALEQSPASANGYLDLGDYYAESGDTRSAIGEYNHTLELQSGRADIHDRLAVAYFKQGARTQAVAQWKLFFGALLRQVNSGRVPESFWTDFARACDHVRTRRVFGDLKPDMDVLLRAYLRLNGNYRSNAVLQSALVATGDPAAGVTWIVNLSVAAADPVQVLADVAFAPWIPIAQRGPIYQYILEAKQKAFEKAEGLEKENALSEWSRWQLNWANYLIQTKRWTQAAEFLASFSPESHKEHTAELVPLELQIAAQLATLDEKISTYRTDPPTPPSAEILRTSARKLFEAGDEQSARKILEFVFARELEEHQLVAVNFLGLAEIRIAAGDTPGALDLLRRLVVALENPFGNLDSAAALLEKTGHNKEALEFLEPLSKATPWEPSFQMRLAKAKIAAGQDEGSGQKILVKIAASGQAPYATRMEAARALAGARAESDFGSRELQLLARSSRGIAADEANQLFFYDARVKAAQAASDPHLKLQLLGNALAETPSRDDARIPAFHAAAALNQNEYALAIIEQLLRQQHLLRTPVKESLEEEEIISSDETQTDAESDAEFSRPVIASGKLSPLEQAQLVRSVGEVMTQLNRLEEALPYLHLAQKLEKAPARVKEIRSEIASVRASLRRQHLNVARQPILHAELEQDRLVRSRLVAEANPFAKPNSKAGEKP
jgi:cellulose synthase operon protein C